MKVLLIVSGGIAAYKSLSLLRLYKKAGHEVRVVMTESAKQFVQPLSFQALCGHAVRDSLFDSEQEAGMDHIELARWPDLIVVAPATANRLAKTRMGVADDLASTLLLATDKPILLVPAMNRLMWANAATQENLAVLQARGLNIMPPAEGEQACGEVGAGRMPEPEAIFAYSQAWLLEPHVVESLQPIWQGRTLLITAGPTHEEIDPVRFIGNRSSGKMGYAIAQAAAQWGAQVTLISGPVSLPIPPGVKKIAVQSAEQMFEQVQQHYAHNSVFISAAAVADFRVANTSEQKIKKQSDSDEMQLKLVKNPDIIAWVGAQTNKPFLVGFAAETENVIEYAREKLQRKNLDMICANQVGRNLGFEKDDNALTLITHHQEHHLQRSSKQEQAQQLLAFIAERIE